ncbi:MAG: RdgB/HAM1 family non-canonical purine NTP pyrophosphatase [Pseudomonadales bacterium]|jgi:XTP/dITP diphosphohydrolase|nr:RdgB/HAM1 family non-canonical purine NTP pyrophosphatase [Pseudomonadales bacterium]
MKVMLATRNNGKIIEMRRLLEPLGLELDNQTDTDIPSPVEDGQTFVENALIKARAVSLASSTPAIADDSGLVVPALDGRPGIYSSRFAHIDASDAENNSELLTQLANQESRAAYFFCCMVFLRHAQDPTPIIAYGQWWGEILREPQGEGGFGYDPLFYVADESRSAAQLPAQTKNRLSHRGQASQHLIAQLSKSLV